MGKTKHINKDDKRDGLGMSAHIHLAQQSG